MKYKRTITSYNLDDPANAELKAEKDKADKTMEWAKMFHTGSLVILAVAVWAIFFGSFEQWLYITMLQLALLSLSTINAYRAKQRLTRAVERAIEEDAE